MGYQKFIKQVVVVNLFFNSVLSKTTTYCISTYTQWMKPDDTLLAVAMGGRSSSSWQSYDMSTRANTHWWKLALVCVKTGYTVLVQQSTASLNFVVFSCDRLYRYVGLLRYASLIAPRKLHFKVVWDAMARLWRPCNVSRLMWFYWHISFKIVSLPVKQSRDWPNTLVNLVAMA